MAVANHNLESMDEERPEEETYSGDESQKNPRPYLDGLFVFKCTKGNNVIMQCNMCLPSKTELSAFKTSTSKFT